MDYRNLGASGLIVSTIGLGCNNFGGRVNIRRSTEIVHRAIDLGVTLFDTADVYGMHWGGPTARSGLSEEYLGRALGEQRKKVVICTKFGLPLDGNASEKGGSRRYIMNAVEGSLQRLGTDWIDLYQIHRPDPRTPIEETLRALDDLVRQGKIRYIACSGFVAWRIIEAVWTSKYFDISRFVASEDEYNLLAREIEAEIIPAMATHGLGLITYSPLASGFLSGKYQRDIPPPEGSRFSVASTLQQRYGSEPYWDKVQKLESFATSRGHTLLELALSWLVRKPLVASVIAGATNVEQVDQNVAAANWDLTPQDMSDIDRISEPRTGGTTLRA